MVRGLFVPSSRSFSTNCRNMLIRMYILCIYVITYYSLHTHFKGPEVLLNSCMFTSRNIELCKTEDKSAAIGATLRLLQLTCNNQEERTKCHIICNIYKDVNILISFINITLWKLENENVMTWTLMLLPEESAKISSTNLTDLSMGKTEPSPAFSRL